MGPGGGGGGDAKKKRKYRISEKNWTENADSGLPGGRGPTGCTKTIYFYDRNRDRWIRSNKSNFGRTGNQKLIRFRIRLKCKVIFRELEGGGSPLFSFLLLFSDVSRPTYLFCVTAWSGPASSAVPLILCGSSPFFILFTDAADSSFRTTLFFTDFTRGRCYLREWRKTNCEWMRWIPLRYCSRCFLSLITRRKRKLKIRWIQIVQNVRVNMNEVWASQEQEKCANINKNLS